MSINFIKKIEPFKLSFSQKNNFFSKKIKELTIHHYNNSNSYKQILNKFNYDLKNEKIESIPFLPAQLFKEIELSSIKKNKVSNILLSSGTSGNQKSKIYLDSNNSHNQIIALSKIMSTILGNERLPMLIIDNDPKECKSSSMSARIAAINGFSLFGKDHTFLLDKNNNIKFKTLKSFLKKYGKKKFFVFGFTSLIYNFFLEKLKKSNMLNFSNAILVHGGGWKKMEDKKVDNNIFRSRLKKKFFFEKIYNYYGMVEQTGSIFLECEKCSSFIATNYSEVLIRDSNFKVLNKGEIGLIQVLSLLPTSYPGHSILTEDLGKIIDEKNCKCSKMGTQFKVFGRSKKSELRGCSDI